MVAAAAATSIWTLHLGVLCLLALQLSHLSWKNTFAEKLTLRWVGVVVVMCWWVLMRWYVDGILSVRSWRFEHVTLVFANKLRRTVYKWFAAPKYLSIVLLLPVASSPFMLSCRQESLYKVLRAYSIFDKKVGYCQGMGFVTALLLMYMGEEVRKLWQGEPGISNSCIKIYLKYQGVLFHGTEWYFCVFRGDKTIKG